MSGASIRVAGLAAVLFSCSPSPGPVSPNVMLVVVDTLRADRTGLAGYELPTTPRLDAFAKEGLVFERAYASAPWTKPSVASILTGLDPRQHRVVAHMDALHSSFRTLAQAFGEAGFQTHAVQSNPYLLSVFGFDGGFIDYREAFLAEDPDGTIASYDRSSGRNVNSAALEFLDRRDTRRPFFLWVHHYEPHHMYLEESAELLTPAARSVPADRRALLAGATMDALVAGTDQLDEADAAYLGARYDSEVRLQDELLGELFDGLAERGLLDRTLVVVTSDHGEEFLEHGDVSHHNDKLFEELVRVPLVMRGPGVEAGRREEPVSLTDLGRTLLDRCGLADRSFPGRAFDGPAASSDAERAVVAHGLLPGRADQPDSEREALVLGEWKLVRERGGAVTLFDLAKDPEERHDLSAGEPDRRAAMLELLDSHLDRRGGVGPEPPPEPEAIRALRARRLEELGPALDALGYGGGGDGD